MHKNSRRDLNDEYLDAYKNMCMYLQSKGINVWCMRRIREDILDMALDNQQRGVRAEAVFGDYQQFCDNVSESAIRQSVMERVCNYIGYALLIVLYCILLEVLLSSHSEIKQGYALISRSNIQITLAMLSASTLAWYGRANFILRFPRQRFALYFIIYIILLAAAWIAIQYLMKPVVQLPVSLLLSAAILCVLCLIVSYGSAWIRYKKSLIV